MKNLILLLLFSITVLSACKKHTDPIPTEQERVSAALTSTEAWQAPIVTVDGVDYSDVYKDFNITFKESTYTSSGGAPVWAASGSWVFINAEATLIKMDGDREVTSNSITGDFLELSFQWEQNTFESGRVNSVKGKQIFKLKKKP